MYIKYMHLRDALMWNAYLSRSRTHACLIFSTWHLSQNYLILQVANNKTVVIHTHTYTSDANTCIHVLRNFTQTHSVRVCVCVDDIIYWEQLSSRCLTSGQVDCVPHAHTENSKNTQDECTFSIQGHDKW